MKKSCIFCSKNFPLDYQIICQFKYWYFIYEINPMRDFHCMLVSKKHFWWIGDINSSEILQSIWESIKICINTIKKSNKNIKTVSIVSLNLWENTKHLHFHLIPIFYSDNIKNINNYLKDWSWINFLWNKEITQDSYKDYIKNIFWKKINYLIEEMDNILKANIKEKVLILKSNLCIKCDVK